MKDTANYLPNESTMKDMKGLKEGPALAPEEYGGVIFTDFVFFMVKSYLVTLQVVLSSSGRTVVSTN